MLCNFLLYVILLYRGSDEMEYYYAVVNGNEYFLPNTVFLDMENEIVNYVEFINNKNYINVNKIIDDNNYFLLKKIYDRCNNFVGATFIDTPYGEKFSKMGYIFRDIDRLSDYKFKMGNTLKACDLLLEGIELSLKLYNEVLSIEAKQNNITK